MKNEYWAQPKGSEWDKNNAISPVFPTQKLFNEWCRQHKDINFGRYFSGKLRADIGMSRNSNS